MYYGLSGYKELYQRAKKNHLPEKCVEELGPYRNSIFNLVSKFDLFSNQYSNKESCKYMENIIRLLTRYQVNDNLINKALMNVVGHKAYNLDFIFYTVYSIVQPKEMERICLKEYITSFYHILLNNFSYNFDREELNNLFNDITVLDLKNILLYLNNSNIPKIYEDNYYPKLYLLAIIISYIYSQRLI